VDVNGLDIQLDPFSSHPLTSLEQGSGRHVRGRRRRCRERAPCVRKSACVQKRKAYEHVVVIVVVDVAVTVVATHRQRHAYEGRPEDTYLWWWWRWW
jgi:hypothetical protein